MYSYRANGETIELIVSSDFIAVRFKESARYSDRLASLAGPEFGSLDQRFEVPQEKCTLFPVAPSPLTPEARVTAALDSVAQQASVERVSPVFVFGENFGIETDRLLVGLRAGTNATQFFGRHGLGINATEGNEYVVVVAPDRDPFEVIAVLDGETEVEYVEPDFVVFGGHTVRPQYGESPATDPLADEQYAISITQARDAWSLAVGDPAIKIAILDEGVDTGHEDLATAIVGSYDATDDDGDQEPNPWDAHGTACAGLAAAIHANRKGIMGIGGGCSILAVRIAYSPRKGERWMTRSSWIRRAVDWCWRNGADVLSNSWGGGAPSSAITNAFERARTQGRYGKGCVIVTAAGNDDSLHGYPSNLDDVLSVSASNQYDEPKTRTSRDGEDWWGSNWGPQIDVAAPGVHNYTTDNSGLAGYNVAPAPAGNYFASFNGTSSSTPIVAGAIGLVLSVHPDFTESEIRDLVRSTADKVGPLPYVNGRNDRMGYGRLNVVRAVRSALSSASHSQSPSGLRSDR